MVLFGSVSHVGVGISDAEGVFAVPLNLEARLQHIKANLLVTDTHRFAQHCGALLADIETTLDVGVFLQLRRGKVYRAVGSGFGDKDIVALGVGIPAGLIKERHAAGIAFFGQFLGCIGRAGG